MVKYSHSVNTLQKERMYTVNSKRFLRKTFLSILLVTAILLGSFSSCLTVYAVEASGEDGRHESRSLHFAIPLNNN